MVERRGGRGGNELGQGGNGMRAGWRRQLDLHGLEAGGNSGVVSAAGWRARDRSRGIRLIRPQEGDETLLNQGSGRLDLISGLDAFQGARAQPGMTFFGNSSTRYLMEHRIAFFVGVHRRR